MKKRGASSSTHLVSFITLLLITVLCSSFAFAHDHDEDSGINFTDPVTYVYFTIAWVALITLIIFLEKEKTRDHQKKTLFWLIAAPVLLSTFYLGGHTVYENIHSATGGPVHWHADFQVWYCGERQNLVDPKFPSNKIGSPLFHEHDDDRIHTEGTVADLADVDLGSFFDVIGGYLDSQRLVYPLNEGQTINATTGDACANGAVGELKVYANGQLLADPANYMYYHHALVPPGDCIIVEFGYNLGDTTNRLCESWDVNGWTYQNYQEKRGAQ